ncbi:undecaprenyl phosphate N,N'-diacetylbacillosamine 1-phosphate transferase [Lachnospiraceae bacterium]|nr:undecaprenyl phosphate N,N'-diacetylbacillosamine 1-phosphate transferase [Lachnospiraceae bacterium]
MVEAQTGEAITGNKICSLKEEYIAKLLKEQNLERVNQTSLPVRPKTGFYVRYIKRMLDFVIALMAVIFFSPVNIGLAIGTYFDVGSPILYRQTRIGKGGRKFQLIKFRSMANEVDENGKLLPPSQRVTRFGKFVRKYSLDELMNFWSVLKGDMSIIGLRPLPFLFEERYSERHKMRNAVRPGLECPRIIEDISVPSYHLQFENDIWYVEHVSFWTDIRMIVLLVRMTFNLKKRTKSAGASGYFIGYDDDGMAVSMKQLERKTMKYSEEYGRWMECSDKSEK